MKIIFIMKLHIQTNTKIFIEFFYNEFIANKTDSDIVHYV